jgi:hypothetical protein
MADVGKKTGKQTQTGRDVYETPEGEMVSEKSTTFEYKDKWINIPTIHGGKQYSEDQLIKLLDKGLIKPTSIHDELEEAIEAAQSRSNSLEFNKGGTPMKDQMELFEDGGLRDEGGTVDEVSGNKVPVGGTKKGVRDDIPAMVSEGEFIFPEDVTRYIGLDKLMQLRQDAKMGLKKMEAMGQMGNGDEATIDDDMPFEIADLIIVGGPMEEPQKKYKGGVLHAQQGTYVGQQQPATGIAGYQPSMYANRAPINPYQYQAPASAFTPPTYQNTQVAPSQPTSGYMPKFVGQGVTRKTVTGKETPRVEAEQFVEDIYLDVKYINRETGDIRTFKFYQGEPISEIPAGYVPYEEGQDPAEGTTPPEGEVTVPTTQVTRSGRDDDPTPPPPPFNWDEATPEAIVNEVNKIQGPAGSVVTGLAFALNPVLGGLAYAATKANEKQTLTKLGEMLKDKDFVKKMSDAGQLKKLKDSLTGLEKKTKGDGKGTVNIDLLGQIGTLIKGVTGALKDVFTPKQEKDAIAGAVSSAADQDPTKKDNTITIVDDPFATSAAAPYFKDDTLTREGLASLGTTDETDRFDTAEALNQLESTSVLGDTSLLNQQGTAYFLSPTDAVSSRPASLEESLFSYAPLAPISVDRISELIGNIDTTDPVKISESIISMSKDVAQPTRPLEDLPPEEQDTADPLTMAQTAMKAMTRDREEQREAAFEPEFLEGLGGPSLGFEAGQVDPALAAAVTSQPQTPTVTTPAVTTPAPTVTTAPRRAARDDDYSASDMMRDMQSRQTQAASVAKSEGVSAPTSGGARSVSTPTGNVETYASKVQRGGGFSKGGLASKPKPKKKATSKKRGLAARK